jgi:hypothetical protein
VGDGTRRGVSGGISRSGDEKAAMAMMLGGKERRGGHIYRRKVQRAMSQREGADLCLL